MLRSGGTHAALGRVRAFGNSLRAHWKRVPAFA
jgi:hypothetical protein